MSGHHSNTVLLERGGDSEGEEGERGEVAVQDQLEEPLSLPEGHPESEKAVAKVSQQVKLDFFSFKLTLYILKGNFCHNFVLFLDQIPFCVLKRMLK